MKVLLLLPLQQDQTRVWGRWQRGAGNNFFNFGVASLAGYLRDKGVAVEVIDPQFFPDPDDLRNRISRGNYDLIGISAYTPTIRDAVETARRCRKIQPRATIVLGGAHPTLFPEETLRDNDWVDYVIAGEGEIPLYQLTQHLPDRSRLDTIAGLAFRSGDHIQFNQPSRVLIDVNTLPRPAYDLFPLNRYTLQATAYKRLPTYTMVVSRGCPYDCTFCQAHQILGRAMRYRAVDKVIGDLQYLVKEHGARGIMFQDTTMPLNRTWMKEFCAALRGEHIDITWMCYSRADNVDRELLRIMRAAGCCGISFGVESANQKSLDFFHKKMTVQDNVDAVNLALATGMTVTATYIIGIPGEDEAAVARTIRLACGLATHLAHFYLPIPYPKSEFHRQCQELGGIREPVTWEDYNIFNDDNPVYINPLLGKEKMLALKTEAIRRYYRSPRVWWRNLKTIDSIDDIRRYYHGVRALSGYFRDRNG